MSRGSGTGYIPDKSHLMSSTLAMLDFFKDGEKAFSNFSAFLESNYDIRSSNTVRMTFATLCKWKLLYEVDFKTYTLTAAGADLLKTHSETSLGRQIQNSTLYFGEILQELETEVLTGSALKQAANQKYSMSFKSSSDLSCRTQYLLGLSFIENRNPVEPDELAPHLSSSLYAVPCIYFHFHEPLYILSLSAPPKKFFPNAVIFCQQINIFLPAQRTICNFYIILFLDQKAIACRRIDILSIASNSLCYVGCSDGVFHHCPVLSAQII